MIDEWVIQTQEYLFATALLINLAIGYPFQIVFGSFSLKKAKIHRHCVAKMHLAN